jgi:hypothetical protein
MADPQSLVYRGQEGTGAAQVFSRGMDPMTAYRIRKQEALQSQYIKAEQDKLKREKNEKAMADLLSYAPQKAWEPFSQQLAAEAGQVRDVVAKMAMSGADMSSAMVQSQVRNMWGAVDADAYKTNDLKRIYDQTVKDIEDDTFIDKEYYRRKVASLLSDDKGNYKHYQEVDGQQMEGLLLNDTDGFMTGKYVKEWVKNLKENVIQTSKLKFQNAGLSSEDIETKILADLYEFDPNGGVKTDENGRPILKISTGLMTAFLENDRAGKALEKEAQRRGVPMEDLLGEYIEASGGGFSVKRNNDFKYKPTYGDGSGYTIQQAASDRYKVISSIVNAFGPDGVTPTEDAYAAMGNIMANAKINGMNISDYVFVPAGTAGKLANGRAIESAANDRLVLQLDKGQYMKDFKEINLDDPGTFAFINGVMNTSLAEGKRKLSEQEVFELAGRTRDDLKVNQSGKTVQEKIKMKEEIDASIPQIVDLPDGALALLEKDGKTNGNEKLAPYINADYEGSSIINVRKENTGGQLWNVFGNKSNMLRVTLKNGKEYAIDLNSEEGKKELYKIEESARDPKVKVKNANGEMYWMKKSEYNQLLTKGIKVELVN